MSAGASRPSIALLGAVCLTFVLLATANSGGYRYGIGDQAFYEPAAQLQLHPDWFPSDRTLLVSQARLTAVDEALAGASRATGLQLPALFFLLYVISLTALCVAGLQLARALNFSPWATAAFLLLMTLRHRIAKTGANTLEGYMHPRQLAFALGLIALACSLKSRWRWAVPLWLVAMAMHPTTAAWFAAFIAGGIIFERVVKRGALAALPLMFVALFAAFMFGPALVRLLPLPSRLFMDPDWIAVFASKDYIFVSSWPAWAWAINLAYLPLLWWFYRRRVSVGAAMAGEARLVAGALTLFAVFIGSVAFSEARLALAVQLQVSRVFWWMDVLFAAYAAWWLTSDPAITRRAGAWAPRLAVAMLAVVAVGRGIYTVEAGGPDREFVRLTLPDDDWSKAMQWLRTQPADWQVLADPDHAWKYGSSVRVAAARDVVLESVKDTAISLYDRAIAMRTASRIPPLADYPFTSADQARSVGRRFSATVLVTESNHALDLPRLYQNPSFIVYDLR